MKMSTNHMIFFVGISMLLSCSYSKKFTKNYYRENESTLQSIRQQFKTLHTRHPFSLELEDQSLQRIGMEIHTDSIKYIYKFRTDQPFLLDTLAKYQFDVMAMSHLISDMQRAHCTWITNLDYYEKRQKKYLVFLSVRHKELNAFLRPEKYFTLAFFDEPQPVDEKGRLMDKEDLKKPRRINNSIFWKISDRVFYALSARFR
jgi:hypothetical protein